VGAPRRDPRERHEAEMAALTGLVDLGWTFPHSATPWAAVLFRSPFVARFLQIAGDMLVAQASAERNTPRRECMAYFLTRANPPLKRWAIVRRPFGTKRTLVGARKC
jgi:hypothetical protein